MLFNFSSTHRPQQFVYMCLCVYVLLLRYVPVHICVFMHTEK